MLIRLFTLQKIVAWVRVFDKQLELPSRPLSAPAASVMERWSTREGYDERTAPPAAARPPCLEKEKKEKKRREKEKEKEKKRDAHKVIEE